MSLLVPNIVSKPLLFQKSKQKLNTRVTIKGSMEVQKVFHVNGGRGDVSYVTNSDLQKDIIMNAKPILEHAVTQLYSKSMPNCLTIADMGCSSGPNSFLVISQVIDAVDNVRQKLGCPSPEYQVFLNDLPGNDFNTIFKSTPGFYEKLRRDKGDGFGACFVAGVPGSFYGRLFPPKTLHFVHSSNAQHWISQVPQGVENNRGNIYLDVTSPPNVFKAYAEQFDKDFSVFLSSRSKELVVGGRMAITIVGRKGSNSTKEPSNFWFWGMLSKAFRDLVSQGIIEEAKLDTFNLPYYAPDMAEIKTIIQSEGSFDLDQVETFDVDWDSSEMNDKDKSGENVARTIRAVIESMVASHFGESIIDELFSRHAQHNAELMAKERPMLHNLVISVTRNNQM